MTTLQAAPTTTTTAGPPSWARVLGVAVVAGVLLGAGDLELQLQLPYPWAGLANSSAVWAVAAFAFGAWVGRSPARATVGAVVLLGVAVEVYYAVAVVQRGDQIGDLTSQNTVMWLFFSLVAGVVFGAAGVCFRDSRTPVAALGLAVPAGVLLGEAALETYRTSGLELTRHLHPDPTALITLALVPVVLALGARRPGVALGATLVAVPLGAFFWVAFMAAGFWI